MRIYWAGDRGFTASGRWHDLQTIRELEALSGHRVLYPFSLPPAPAPQMRAACLDLVAQADVVLAYVGSYDTGTAHEMEFAAARGIPMVAWSDAGLVKGEVAGPGRRLIIAKGRENELAVPVRPMNSMSVVWDAYLELSEMDSEGLSPGALARWLLKALDSLKRT